MLNRYKLIPIRLHCFGGLQELKTFDLLVERHHRGSWRCSTVAHGTPCVGITGTSMTPMQFVGNSTSLGHQVQCQIAHLDLVQLQGWDLMNIAISSVEEVKQDY